MARALLWAALCWSTCPSAALADDDHVLLRLLRDGDSFRVRARAALALARSGDPAVSRALEHALEDQHAAVRAAAATALARVGDASSLVPLRRAKHDPAPDVARQARLALRAVAARAGQSDAARAGPPRRPTTALRNARFVVVVGDMRNDSGLQDGELLVALGESVRRELQGMRRVAVLAARELDEAVLARAMRRGLPAFRLEANLRRVVSARQGDRHAVRAEVSLLLLDEPGRNLRSMLRGAATGVEGRRGSPEEQLRRLSRTALQNAVRSAMSNARRALEAAALQHRGPARTVREGPAEARLHRPRPSQN